MNKDDLNRILDDLILLGEDAEELNYWRAIYDDLNNEEQEKASEQPILRLIW